MSLCQVDRVKDGLPIEARLLEDVELRLVKSASDRRRFDRLLEEEHYLHNANSVGWGTSFDDTCETRAIRMGCVILGVQ